MLRGSEEPTSGGSGARIPEGSRETEGRPGSGRKRVGPLGARAPYGELSGGRWSGKPRALD